MDAVPIPVALNSETHPSHGNRRRFDSLATDAQDDHTNDQPRERIRIAGGTAERTGDSSTTDSIVDQHSCQFSGRSLPLPWCFGGEGWGEAAETNAGTPDILLQSANRFALANAGLTSQRTNPYSASLPQESQVAGKGGPLASIDH